MKQYQPSGGASATTFALFLVALAVAVPLAVAYDLLLEWVPYIQLNVLIACLFGAALGALAKLMVTRGHCRSSALGYLLTLLIALGGVAASWGVLYARLVQHVAADTGVSFAEAGSALPFARIVALRMASGWNVLNHDSSADSFNGNWVVLVWIFEAVTICFCAVQVALPAIRRAYCERCARWCFPRLLVIPGVTRADIEPKLHDMSSVVSTAGGAPDAMSSVALQGELCAGCSTAFVSLMAVETTVVGNRTHVKRKPFARQLVLDVKAREAFEQRTRR